MGKKAAHSGMSPKDRSINMMDKFITRNANREKNQPILPARRKDPNVPINLWPLQDQLKHRETISDAELFDETYSAYSTWYDEVKRRSGVYPATFLDFTRNLKPEMRAMWECKTLPKIAVLELRKKGVY